MALGSLAWGAASSAGPANASSCVLLPAMICCAQDSADFDLVSEILYAAERGYSKETALVAAPPRALEWHGVTPAWVTPAPS